MSILKLRAHVHVESVRDLAVVYTSQRCDEKYLKIFDNKQNQTLIMQNQYLLKFKVVKILFSNLAVSLWGALRGYRFSYDFS